MQAKKKNSISDLTVGYEKNKKGDFYCHATLYIDGYEVKTEWKRFKILTEAVDDIKLRMVDCMMNFKPVFAPSKELAKEKLFPEFSKTIL